MSPEGDLAKLGIVPIVILHRNEFASLERMLTSIRQNTRFPHRVFVVDNNSSRPDSEENLRKIGSYDNVEVIRSNANNWILGFNLAMRHAAWPENASFYVFSDADIVVPAVDIDGKCWLEYMLAQMAEHACIGKLGISLVVDDIDNAMLSETVTRQRQRFDANPRIGTNAIAPVDTTLAVYRSDFFIGDRFEFTIGHATMARPYYYTCRTAAIVQARHLGWYEQFRITLDDVALKEKIRCFAKYGAYIEPSILAACGTKERLFYQIVHPISILYWGLRVSVSNLRYLTKNFPRKINKLQFGCR